MSLQDLGKNDISEETHQLLDRIASKDSENAGLRSQLLKREADLNDLRAALDETINKLRNEADRALRFETDLARTSEELRNEKITSQNTTSALRLAQERIQSERNESLTLEATLDTMTLEFNSARSQREALESENKVLRKRISEMESNLKSLAAQPPPQLPKRSHRRRSSSFTDARDSIVEKELNDTRLTLAQKEKELRSLEEKVTQLNTQLVGAENRQVAGERSTQTKLKELEATLEEKERELEALRSNDAAAREEELLARIDEDEAKITVLEFQLSQVQVPEVSRKELTKLQAHLSDEKKKSARLESERHQIQEQSEELEREKGVLSHELARVSQQLSSLQARISASQCALEAHSTAPDPSTSPDNNDYAEQLETLLLAVARLRDERNGLKRTVDFLETESRIAKESLNAQLAKRTASALSHDKCRRAIRRLDLVLQTLTITADYFQGQYFSSCKDLEEMQHKVVAEQITIQVVKGELERSQDEKDSLQGHLDRAVQHLATFTTERDTLQFSMNGQLRATLEELSEVRSTLRTAQLELSTLSKNHASLESERNALSLQVANLQTDLSSAQSELNTLEQKYTALQAQRLSHMPSSQATQSLRNQIEELEGRVDRRTEQIGILQHDLRRLQTNLQLQEDRVLELTAERDTLACEKEAMVDDCAEARDARDLARKELEATEEELEKLANMLKKTCNDHSRELATVVEVLMTQRSAFLKRLSSLESKISQQMSLSHVDKAHIVRLEELNVHLIDKVQMLDKMSHSLQHEVPDGDSSSYDHHDLCVALSVSQLAFQRKLRQLCVSEQNVSSLSNQLAIMQGHLNQAASDLVVSRTRITDLESTIMTEHASATADITSKDQQYRSQLEMLQQELEAVRSNEDIDIRLRELQSHHDEQITALRKQLDSLIHERDDHAATATCQFKRVSKLEAELARARLDEVETLALAREELATTREDLLNARADVARLEALHKEEADRLAELEQQYKLELVKAKDEMRCAQEEHQSDLAAVKDGLKAQEAQLKARLEETEADLNRLQEEHALHSQSKEQHITELAETRQRAEESENLLQELRGNVEDVVQRLEAAQEETSILQKDKQHLEENITVLEAEIQRLLSLTQSLELRAKDSANSIVILTDDLNTARAELAESQKLAKAYEINISLQGVENQKLISSLRRELNILRSQPNLNAVVQELEMKNNELEDLLKEKCAEIENFDERMLEQLKINKKLTAKVDNLTRKIQALQTKLSAAKAAAPSVNKPSPVEPVTTSNAISSTTFIAPSKTLQSSEDRPPSVSPRSSCFTPTTAGSRQLPLANREHSTTVPATTFAMCETTPESHRPEPHRVEVFIHEAQVSTSAGRKRRAPDDDDRDAIPAEGRYGDVDTGITPRQRRTLYSAQSGFTPVRNSTPRTGLRHLSPSKSRPQMQGISDVTNSPRAKSARLDNDAGLGKKKSWLGKIRGGTAPFSDSKGSVAPSRIHVFEQNQS